MSQQLDLEFIKRPPFALSTLGWYGLLILIISLGLAAFVLQQYRTKQVAQKEISFQLQQLNQHFNHKKLPAYIVDEPISSNKKIQIETTVSALTIPWGDLLSAIEKSDTQDVALLNLNPSSKKQQVILSGEAKNLQSVLTYIQKLEAQPMLENTYLQKHSVDEANISKPVKFTVFTQWHTVQE